MKALTLKEPWASYVYEGRKTIETRTWKTDYRGPILLTASKKPAGSISGRAFAVAWLVDCRPMTKEDEKAACCEIYPKAYAWIFSRIVMIIPFFIRGQLGLFDVPDWVIGKEASQ